MPLRPYLVTAQSLKLKGMIYARRGWGKTYLACSAQSHPDLAPILLVNIEGGGLSIAGRNDITAVDISRTSEMEELLELMITGDAYFSQFKTVVIDSVSKLQEINLREIVAVAAVEAKKKNRTRNIDKTELDDYGVSTTQIRRIINGFRALPIHLIVTASERQSFAKNDAAQTVPVEVSPNMTAKLADSVAGDMDFVWYGFQDDAGNKHILTRDAGVYRAKTRGIKFREALGLSFQITEGENSLVLLPQLYDTLLASETPDSYTSGPVAPIGASNLTPGQLAAEMTGDPEEQAVLADAFATVEDTRPFLDPNETEVQIVVPGEEINEQPVENLNDQPEIVGSSATLTVA